MSTPDPTSPHIIGLTGSFGSGCSYVAREILSKLDAQYRYGGPNTVEHPAYRTLSLSDVLREQFKQQTGQDPEKCQRKGLQDFGDKVRLDKGHHYFAEQVISEISNLSEAVPEKGWIVDSIRNPAEVRALRNYSNRFFLFGIYADTEMRWKRVKTKYNGNLEAFDRDDKRDKGDESVCYGQQVGECFAEADVVVANQNDFEFPGNDDFKELAGRLSQYVRLTSRPLERQQPIRSDESSMAMAYAAAQRSSCMKRKVGAVIVDESGDVISSGFNEVPKGERPCIKRYRVCYRDWRCTDFFKRLGEQFPEVAGQEAAMESAFRSEFKILDYCRALHAEERAILNLARSGRSTSLATCTLFSTTYPCRLCANKIANVGMKEVVYLEPYPQQEAKDILRAAGVPDRLFEGVTFKAYFRLYGEEK